MPISVRYRILGAALVGVATSSAPLASAIETATVAGAATASQPVEFEIFLPVKKNADLDLLLAEQQRQGSPRYHQWLTPRQFDAEFGPDTATIARISNELGASGLALTSVHAQHLHVAGTVRAVERAFSTRLSAARFSNGAQTLTAATPLRLTPTLAANGAIVSRFTGVAHMHRNAVRLGAVDPENRASPIGGYWFDDLKQAYWYPSYKALTGKGVVIGILMSGAYNPPDMDLYFHHEKLKTPAISELDIAGGAPYDPNFSFETHLDIQQSGGMAPDASIVLYNIPDLSDASIIDGLVTIIEGNQADVVNMSFGGFENGYSAAYPFNNGADQFGFLTVYDDLFKQGNAQGITFVASSGDLGALEAPPAACFQPNATSRCGSFYANVSTPASSPHVTAVGGSNLVTVHNAANKKDLNSAYVRENAYGDPLTADIFYGTPATGAFWGSGGGISQFYAKPDYQNVVNTGSTRFRTLPDVSLHMGGCPNGSVSPCGADRSYDIAAIDGAFYGVVGTSASAPDFTGLLALKIQRLGTRLGNVNYDIYSMFAAQLAHGPFEVFHHNIPGYNGKYYTSTGYNYVLGTGTLFGKTFVLGPNLPVAGIPQTPTNP
jgi:subtilase family serine protease